jgi:hypothetical protein
MIHERYLELMNKELDGETSSDESTELRRYLESNAEARTYYAELCSFVEVFGEAGEVQPPGNLEQRILCSINERRALEEVQREKTSRLSNIFSPRKKLGLAFAAGIAAGLVILLVIYRALPESSSLRMKDLYGTLAERETAARSMVSAEPVDFNLSEVSGTASVKYLDDACIAALELTSTREIEVVISLPEEGVLENFNSRQCAPSAIQSVGGNITLRTTGRCGFTVTFRDSRNAHPPVNVRIFADGAPIFDKTIVAGVNIKP